MKQQMKRLVAREITVLQADIRGLKQEVIYFERKSNKDDPSTAQAFKILNAQKQLLRKAQRKMKKLVALQNEIKSMVGYMVKDDNPSIDVTISNMREAR